MGEYKEFLKELEYYSMNEDGLEIKKNKNRKQYNLKRIVDELRTQVQDEAVKQRYLANKEKAKALVESFSIVHNTSLGSLISIIQNDAIMSINEMDKKDISFNYRISYRGIDEEMHNFVFGTVNNGDPINGLYEIKLKRNVEEINEALFIPKCYLEYGQEVLKGYFCDIKQWRAFLAEYIAITMDNPSEYLSNTPVYLRPELLFPQQVQLSYFESIICYTKAAYDELIAAVKEEFGESSEVLKIIKTAEIN